MEFFMSEPTVNSEVPPSQVFGKYASNVKTFPVSRPPAEDAGQGFANFEDGIPSDYSADSPNPLKARIEDINAIGRLASGFHHYRQCGGIVTYNDEVASIIDGYPKGAILDYWNGTNLRRVESLIEDNRYDFVKHPDYIDGKRWAYVDAWVSPYGIYVDPSRVARLDALSGGMENPDLFWEDDDSAYQYVIDDANSTDFFGKLVLRKSRWIRMESDCFLIMTSTKTADLTAQDPILYYVYTGFRLKDSSGTVSTFEMTIDEAGDVDTGSVFPICGDVRYMGSNSSVVGWESDAVSTCLYMRAGSFVQLVYATALSSKFNISIQVVRLMR